MVCLAQQISSHTGGHAAGICQHFHFAGAGRHVDSYACQRGQLLGCGHIGVAGAENLINLGHGACAVGHGGNGLCPANFENALHAAEVCGKEDGRVHLAIFPGGRAEHHFLAPGHSSRYGQHQHGGEQWRLASGYIQAHALDGQRALLAFHPGGCLQFHGSLRGILQLVKIVDVAVCQLNGFLEFLRHKAGRFLYLGLRNGKCLQVHTIKTVAVFMQSPVAMQMYCVHDGTHNIKKLRDVKGRAAYKLCPLLAMRFRDDGHGNSEGEITESFFRWAAPECPGHRLPSACR